MKVVYQCMINEAGGWKLCWWQLKV